MRRGQVGDERVELAVCAGPERGGQTLLELFGEQSSFDGRLTEPLGYFFALCVGCPQYRSSRHTLEASAGPIPPQERLSR